MNFQFASIMDTHIYHVRVGRKTDDEDDEYHIFSFYNVVAEDKHHAGLKARKQFSQEFGADFKQTEAEYIWDAGIHVDLKRMPAIN